MDIPNIARYKESLFEAEVHRCMEYCNMVENLPENAFMFTIMDELFTGTNPLEGAAGSYAVCDYVGKSKNSLLIVTTHFNELTKLGIKHNKRFSNKKFVVDYSEDGQIIRNYVLQEGVSDQNIAIELLYQKGYNTSIVNKAMKTLKNIKK
jgi:DNA mismatch repair protein MutS